MQINDIFNLTFSENKDSLNITNAFLQFPLKILFLNNFFTDPNDPNFNKDL